MISVMCKGLLAHILDTSIPEGYGILCCHACNNAKCSNPNHLYWGTGRENYLDTPRVDGWTLRVQKFGYKKACQMNKRSSKQAAKAGAGNKGKPKSEEHRRKISEAMMGKRNRAGRE